MPPEVGFEYLKIRPEKIKVHRLFYPQIAVVMVPRMGGRVEAVAMAQ